MNVRNHKHGDGCITSLTTQYEGSYDVGVVTFSPQRGVQSFSNCKQFEMCNYQLLKCDTCQLWTNKYEQAYGGMCRCSN